jgi:hypothetical protein
LKWILVVNGEARVLGAYPELPVSVPIEHDHEAFGPDTIAALATALEDALHQLRLTDRNDPAVTMLAKRIIELARQGERDPARLRDQAIRSFRHLVQGA